MNFVPRSRVGIFRNECTRSTPLDPKLTFWCVSYYLGAFRTVWLPYETRCKTGRTSAKSSCHEVASKFFTTNAPDPPHWTKTEVLVRFELFGCIPDRLVALRYLVQNESNYAKVRAMKSRRNFLQQTHLIHPIDSKLTFWCISYYLGAFGTVLLPHETRCKTGRTSAKVRATKSLQNVSQRTHPIHPIGA